MRVLTDADVAEFLEFGRVHLKDCFPREVAAEWVADGYRRLGIDPDDPTTWKEPRTHMKSGGRYVKVREFAPKAYHAMCDLLGEDRLKEDPVWGDWFIVNLAQGADEPWIPPGPDAPGWHVDGDFFWHYLDSPEQALLVIVLWTDVVEGGGPTYVATDSVPHVARWLADRPEGVDPYQMGSKELIRKCSRFEQATGRAGDVILLHPHTLHAVSQNVRRIPRVITNPPVALKEPFRFSGPDLNLVERTTLRALGREELDWRVEERRVYHRETR